MTISKNLISLPKLKVAKDLFEPARDTAAGFFVLELPMALPPATNDGVSQPGTLDRARKLTKPFAGDDKLDQWAAKLVAAADDFQKNKRSDPLGGFLVTHLR